MSLYEIQKSNMLFILSIPMLHTCQSIVLFLIVVSVFVFESMNKTHFHIYAFSILAHYRWHRYKQSGPDIAGGKVNLRAPHFRETYSNKAPTYENTFLQYLI